MTYRAPLSILLAATLTACGESSPTPTDAQTDVAVDAQTDARADAPADSQSGCTVPAVRLGDSMEAVALATSPARCGQSPFQLVTDPSLGTPTGMMGARQSYTAAVLQALATAGGINLPVPLSRDVTVDQIAYTTQDRGHLTTATTLVAYPRNLSERTSFETILVLHGTSGFTDACAPSSTTDARALAAAFASAGYIVVAPDYLGMHGFGAPQGFPHPYLVGTATAIASLDALRAGIRHVAAQGTETCASARYVAFGGSQGGHAALWVDRIGGWYAPELTLMGTVATVPPADLEAETNRALRETVQATANVAAFLTVSAPWYGLGSRFSEVFRSPYDTVLPAMLAATCSPEVRDLTRETVFTQAMLDAGSSTAGVRSLMPWGCLVTENGITSTSIPRATPTGAGYGILWVLGESDQLVNTPIERTSFQTLCRAGYRMQYLECAGAAHTRATTWALPEILDFVRARFDGRPLDAASMCMVNAPTRCRATPAAM